MKNNKLIIGDTEYVLDAAYRLGASERRWGIPYVNNPYGTLSDKNSQWDYGHTNEDAGFHTVDGVDLVNAVRNGTVYRIDY